MALETTAGTPQYNAVSKTQSAAIAAQLLTAQAVLTAEEKADLTVSVCSMKWADEAHVASVLSHLTTDEPQHKLAGQRRRGLQKFTEILNYGDDAFWVALTSADTGSTTKLQCIMSLAIRLGLRLPSEPTLKALCSAWVVATHPASSLHVMEQQTKSVFFKHVKVAFDNLRRRAAEPMVWISELPADPLCFLRDYPSMFSAAYIGEAKPIPCKLDLATVHAFDQSFGCRGSARVASFSARPSSSHHTPAIQLSPVRSEGFALERLASQFLNQMQSVAAAQNRMLEMALANQQGPGSLRSMAALMASPAPMRLEDRRGPAILDRQTLIVEEVDESQAPSLVQRGGSTTSITTQSPAKSCGALAPTATTDAAGGSPSPSAAGELQVMLDALASRQAEKKEEAKARKAAVCAAQASEHRPSVEGGSVPATPKAKVMKRPASATVTAASDPPAMPPAKRPAAASNGFGCSKCRWSQRGCSQCKDPTFGGFKWNVAMGE